MAHSLSPPASGGMSPQIKNTMLLSARQESRYADGVMTFFVEPILEYYKEGMAQLKKLEANVSDE